MTKLQAMATHVAVISGASRRLGLFLTEQLLKEGWRVHVITRSSSLDLKALSCKHLFIHSCDDATGSSYSCETVSCVLQKIKKQEVRIHLLVNNASVFEDDVTVSKKGWEAYEAMMFIHMQLPALLIESLKTHLSDAIEPGNIVSITDIYALNPNQEFAFYCSTKAGLESLTKSYAKKLASGVRVNAIQPGPIKFLPEHEVDHQTAVLDQTLLPFEGGFWPIYQTLQFILQNNYLTGSSIPVDGGRSLVRG